MKLENEFTVEAPIEEAWDVLLDLERVTPCLPGAALTEQEGEAYKGVMTVRLGPVSQKYNGTVKIDESDESERRAVLKADGKDARGQGTARATITTTMHEENGSTNVKVETDMQVTGKAAQFGRGVQQDVAAKLIGQFADCLQREIMGENVREEPAESAATASASNGSATGSAAENGSAIAEDSGESGGGESEEQPRRRIIQQDTEPEPLDLGEASRDAVLKRVIPVVVGLGVAGVGGLVFWLVRRRSARAAAAPRGIWRR